MNMRRVLVTGSRRHSDVALHRTWLAKVDAAWGRCTLVSGACPSGTDLLCEQEATRLGWAVERHPADWSMGGRAGPLRNQSMVDLGADVCIAFPLPGSRGTWDCVNRAKAAGIPVRIATEDKP